MGSPQTISLIGKANAPVTVAPTQITTFWAYVGQISDYQTITVTNNDTANPLTITGFQLSGDFQQTSTTCGSAPPYTLAPSSSCNVTVGFDPTIGGTRSGQLQIYDSAATSPQVVNFAGTGLKPLTLNHSSLAFSAQLVGTTSAPKSLILTNHESQPETFTLTPSGDFTANSTCATGAIAANATCTIFVNFTPSSTNPTSRTGSLVVTDTAPGGTPLTIPLTGSATATNPAAAVAVVSPGAGPAGTVVPVTITGNGWTHFTPSSVITFVDTASSTNPADITAAITSVPNANTINANLTLTGGAGVVYGARNITVKTPLTGGGTETATLKSAFIISDPSQTHQITAVSPAFGTQGQTLNVDLTATGTNFVQGTTFANFGDGITVNGLTINSATTATANISISNTTPIGYRTITLATGGEIATSVLSPQGNPIFQIGPNNAALVSVSSTTPAVTPVSVPQSFAGPIYLTATGTHFLQNATTVSISGGVVVGDVLVTSPTTATAQVVVPANAAIGVDNVSVATGGEIASLANSFAVTGSTPALVSVAPASAKQGDSTTVVITGNAYTAFNACPGGVITADFTGEISSPTVNVISANQVSVPITVAQDANVGGITANLICGGAGQATLFPFSFSITPSAAAITSVIPNSVPQGGQVTLNVAGVNTNWIQGTTTASFYPAGVPVPAVNEVTINSATSAQLAISVPANTPPGTYGFYMATGGQIVSASIKVYANTPTLTMSPANGLVPSTGANSFSVSFTGQFTHLSQSGTVPVIAGQGVTLTNFTVNSPVSATATINIAAGAATGTRLVTFTTGGEIVTTYFNVTTTPVGIVSISPYHSPQSTTLNVEIVGLNTHFTAGTTQVIFGGPQITVNSVTVNSATDLVANITTSYTPSGGSLTPTPPGWNAVYVNTGAEMLITGFSVDTPATPTILSVSPNSAPQGSSGNSVNITGSLTNWVQGQSQLILGAGVTVANLTITSPTTATAVIGVSPTAPVGGNSVIMITGAEYDSGTGFSVTPSAAYISNIAPNISCQGNLTPYCNGSGGPWVVAQLQTTTVNITGVGTHWLQGETTFSFGSGVVIDQVTINSPTSATVQITVLSSAPVGYATVTANTDGENASIQQGIDIEEGSPTLLAISPGSAQQGATLNLEVLGRFTNWPVGLNTVTATFNQDITVNSVNVIDSETLIANITVSPWAYVDFGSPCGHVLTITSGSQQVSTAPILDNFCVAQDGEEITSVVNEISGTASAVQGSTETVDIAGMSTNFLNGQTQVSFNDSGIQVGIVQVIDNTHLKVPIAVTTSSSTGYKTVTVTTYGQVASQQFAFQVVPGVAHLTEAIPNQAQQGVQNLTVKLIGQYSHFSADSTATFGAGITVVGTPAYVSPTEIDAVINIDPLSFSGGRNVTVTTPNVSCANQPPIQTQGVTYAGCTPGNPNGTGSEIVNANVFQIIAGPAIITNVSPNTGNEGQEIVFNITGSATHWQQNFTQFYIAGGGSDITVNDVIINSATSATVDMTISQTANPGPRSIYMVTAGESLSDAGAFVVTGGVPAISYLTPNNAQPGTTELQVTIVGNAYTQWTAGTTMVNFGPGITVVNYTVDNASHISADIDIGPTCTSPGVPAGCAQYGYRTVVVQTGTQGLTGSFNVVPPPPPPTPYIWYESPSTGIPGQTLTIRFAGVNTEWNPDPVTGTQLTGWNSSITVNSFQITSATSAIANITIAPDATASTSALTFTTNGTASYGQEVDNAQFRVVIAQPVLNIVDPGSGMQGAQNIIVNILGQFTAFDSTTTFSFGPGITVNGPPTILGPTTAQQSISIGQETPTGGYAVTATTPDAPAIAQVVGGAGFSVTPSLATILTVTPNTSPQGTTITVDVQGSNTHWNGSTTFSFGAGTVVTSVVVNSSTDATVTLAIPPLASEGTTYAQARTGGEVATLNQAFVVTAGTPLLLSAGPGSIRQQGSAVFTILSQATNWSNANPPVIDYGPGITLTNVNVTSPTSMTVNGFVQPTTPVGYRNLTVTTGTQVLSINNAVYVSPGPAVVNGVSPNTGGQGVNLPAVNVTGINTHWQQGITTLAFPGVLVNSFTVNSATSITANITVNTNANPGQVSVTVTTLGEVATGTNVFTITQTQPQLVFVNPPSLPQGQTQDVTLTGVLTNFSSSSTVDAGAGVIVNSVTFNSVTSLTANLSVQPTAALGNRAVTVTTGAEIVSSPSLFKVTAGPAAIAGLSPNSGGQGQSVTVLVTGSQTHFSAGTTTASLGGGIAVTGISVIDALHANVTVQIPNSTALGAYNVSLTTGGEVATILGGFAVINGTPQISVVNPPTGNQGATNQNVTLTGLFTHWVNGTSVADFGSGITVNSTTVNNPTSAVANISINTGATLGSRNVTVTTGAEVASITGGFTVLAGVPALTTTSPTMGQAGTTVNLVVNGVFTTFQQGFTTVTLGDGIVTNFVTVNSTTQLTANITIPSNATVGNTYVSVTYNSQTLTLNNAFAVTPGTPVITQINPNIGAPGNSVTVTIIGQYTNWVNGTTVANFGPDISVGGAAAGTAGPVTVNSPTNLTAQLIISSGAALGPVTVVTTTGGEVENVPGGFTIQPATIPAPTLLSLSPGSNAGGMPINSNIIAVFSQPMNRTTITTSSVLLYLNSNPGQGNIPVAGTVNVDPTGRVMTFAPSSLLAVNSTYYLQMTNAIKDATGNTFSQYTTYLYTTAAANTTAPTVIAANPPPSSTAGTNVPVQLEFSVPMDQATQAGITVSTGGSPVAGTYSWNAPVNCCSWGPGTIVTFTPTVAYSPGTTYTVAWSNTVTDTAGNAATPGSFTFTTGSGPDTTTNNTSVNFSNQTNVGTNFAPVIRYTKPINPIDINTSTLLLYNGDSGKYVGGTVTVAPNGLSATFTPTIPLLPNTYYRLYQAGGYYDVDGNYLNGANWYFTTGSGADLTPPSVSSISPADGATSVPLNGELIVHFSSAIDPASITGSTVAVTPAGGSPVLGSLTLSSDLATLIAVANAPLQPNTVYTVQIAGYRDVVGNVGVPFTSTFTTANSALTINVSTGFDGSGNLITTNGTADGHWTVVPTASTPTPPDTVFSTAGTPQPLYMVGPGNTGWYSGWPVNGPNSDWITINPNSTTSNTHGVYSTTFTIPGPSVPANLCLVGYVGIDDNGELGINGTSIMSNLSAYTSLAPINIPISSYLVVGSNTLSLAWGTTDNSYEAFRLTGVIETCGASLTGGLKLVSATPSSGSTGVATNTTITMNFNNPIDPATVNATTLPVMIGYNSNQEITGNYAVTGSQVVFTPASPFPTNTQIYVGTCNGPLDLAGDSAGGCYTALMSFTTGSTSTPAPNPLQVMAFAPAANAANVGLRAPVMATFNRSVNLGTVNSSSAALFAGDSQSPWCVSFAHSQDDATLSFNCYALPASTTLTAILNSGIKDWQGNTLQNFTSQFTTSQYDSNTNGSIITTRPGNGASGVNAGMPIVLYTNLPINPSTATGGIQVAQNNTLVPGTVQVLDNGFTLQFTPSVPFTAGALIQWWTNTSLMESTYNTPINATSGYFTVAASTATLVPTVQTTSPPAYTNPVPLNTIFDVQFNTPLNPSTITSSNIYLYDSSTGLNVAATYSQPQPNEVLMVPTSALSANHYIYVYVKSGLQSTTSVPATATNWYEYTGTTADSTVPTVVSAVPFNGSANIGVNISPGVVFNKPVDQASLNSSTFQILNGATPIAGGYTFNTADTRIQFVPYAPLPANTTLTMNINGVVDRVGHPVTFTSSFQTGGGPDFTAPSVVWSSVASNESIPTNSMITVQFSESMDLTTFTAGQPGACGNFYIRDTLVNDCIAATLTWSADQSTAYLVPAVQLSAGRQYQFVVQSGTDLAGNTMSGYNLYFYATFNNSSVAPTVTKFNPIGGKTGLGTNAIIEAQFSAPIDPTSISGVTLSSSGGTVPATPVLSAGNTVLQLVPATPLTANTTYTMNIAGVNDPVGNAVATVNNSFTTGATYDIAAPSAITSDPPSGSTVGTNVIPKLVFNEPVNPITVSNSTFRMFLNDTGQFIPLTVTPSADGLTVTMTPQIALLPNTYYHFQACCGYQDQDGNNGSQADIYFYTGGGAVTTGPTVSVTPLPGSTGIPLNAQVTATLNVPMDPASWNQSSIQLLNGVTPVAGTVSFTNNQTLTFVPAANLATSTTYTINVSNFTDANGNTVVPYQSTFTTGTAAATGGLTVSSTNITNGSTNVSSTQPIIINFSQILDPATVNSATLKVMNGWNSNNAIAGTYTVNGNSVTFTPLSPYPAGATIYVGECGGPTDVLGDMFLNGSCYGQQIVYFTVSTATQSPIPLQVISVSPPDGAMNVGRDQAVAVTFNNSILSGSANSYNSQLYAGQSLQDAGSYSLSADNRTLTFNVGSLYNNTNYTIAFPAGGISDMAGNKLATTFTSTFSTIADPTTGNGGVSSTAPGTNASSVPANTLLTLYLNRPANPSSVTGSLTVTVNGQVYAGTVQADASGYQIQYTPTVAFPNGATVQWFFSGASDIYGNPLNGTSGYFYTAPAVNLATAQPTVVAVSPTCCGLQNVPTNAEVDIQFSQPLNPATVTAANFYQNTGPAIAYTVALVSPTEVRITPNSGFAASTQYGFCSNNQVQGTNGVNAQATCWLTYFTTGTAPDPASGTVTIGPPNGSQNVGTNAYIRLQFSKPADRTTVNSSNVQITAGGNPIAGSWTYNYSSNNLVGANFYPLNPLPQSTAVQVAASGILDYAGNGFSEPTVQFTTGIQPDYTTPVASLDFGGGATGIAANASFTCRYSEPIDPSSITPNGVFVYSYVINAAIPVTYAIAPDMMSVTMTPANPLLLNSQYYYACYNAIDLTGNAQGNVNASFYTGSSTSSAGPVLVQANPPNGMANVPVNTSEGPWNSSSLGLLFNEPVAASSLGNITLTPQGGSPIPIGAVVEDGNYIASITLPYALQPNTSYTYNVTGVTDLNGNAIAPVTSSFTTGGSFDFSGPSVASTVPVNSSTNVSVTTPLSITFSEAMNPVLIDSNHIYLRTHNTQTTVPATFTISSDYKTVTLTPTVALAASTIYDLVTSNPNWCMTDIAGNNINNCGLVVQSSFTTGTPTPVNGVCGSANGGTFTSPPTANLCSTGTVSGLTNNGTLSWTCNGQYGGANAPCSATITPAQACLTPPSGLVSWWTGDDTANDIVGGNNGTLENSAGYALGEVNDAFSLNGSNQYVLIAQPVPGNLQIQGAITLSAWIYPTAYPTDHGSGAIGIIAGSQHDGNFAGATIYYDARVNPDSVTGAPIGHIGFNLGDGTNWHVQDTLTQVPLNQWTLVTATATSGGSGQVYYNGVLQPSSSGQYPATWNGTVSYSGSWFAIGQEVNENRPFTGLIDDVQVYNTALTATQVQSIYNAGNAGMCH
ncbi:MAG TPA: Ig-like domain-containing protein [Terracidiphilus sp.]|nr:Ig-like domain-containing protein [Terracidiphilus sp.]